MSASDDTPKGSKVIDFGQPLLAELNRVASEAGESANTIARMCLRAGLAKIKAENYALFSLDCFKEKQSDRDEMPAPGSTARPIKLIDPTPAKVSTPKRRTKS